MSDILKLIHNKNVHAREQRRTGAALSTAWRCYIKNLLELFISCQYHDIRNPELTNTKSDTLLKLFNQNHDLTEALMGRC